MSDYGGYRALRDQARAEAVAERSEPLVDCPVCGTPLERRARDGMANCPLGHFRTRATTKGELGAA